MSDQPSAPTDVEAIALAIDRYLDEHPGAADTPAGIARWWLTGEVRLASIEQIEHALELLLNRGLLRRDLLPDGNCVYGRVRR
jgi:hypothetical protein